MGKKTQYTFIKLKGLLYGEVYTIYMYVKT